MRRSQTTPTFSVDGINSDDFTHVDKRAPVLGYRDNFTVHFRPVGRCNADCSYCSAANATSASMSLTTALSFCNFLPGWFKRRGVDPSIINICYIGGELLVMRSDDFEAIVFAVRSRLQHLGFAVVDSAQTNLVGSKKRIDRLLALFDGRVGTSVDHHTNHRTIDGDSSLYASIFEKNHAEHLVDGRPLGSVVVVEKNNVSYLVDEVNRANRKNYNLTLQPVFGSGSFSSELTPSDILASGFLLAFDAWLFSTRIVVEPFYSLFLRRLCDAHGVSGLENCHQGCPFKSDCISKSIHVEPDGGLFLCQPFADKGIAKLGYVDNGSLDDIVVSRLSKRNLLLHTDCQSCEYLKSCTGGCMVRTVEIDDCDYHGKDRYCDVWKALFGRMDSAIEKFGTSPVAQWLSVIGARHG